ncbi:hypothetical protein C8F04DRAFT_1289199 [Mycena alexandri]|uniref:Uncharacterized protein n=1 Tax=Mycena alexandri TaxID=1745969 RepID=A0AAD6WVK7_9AGAR|nr:hypothetical protein C8F04DRAFT_1289199 [Mycena alexandri]
MHAVEPEVEGNVAGNVSIQRDVNNFDHVESREMVQGGQIAELHVAGGSRRGRVQQIRPHGAEADWRARNTLTAKGKEPSSMGIVWERPTIPTDARNTDGRRVLVVVGMDTVAYPYRIRYMRVEDLGRYLDGGQLREKRRLEHFELIVVRMQDVLMRDVRFCPRSRFNLARKFPGVKGPSVTLNTIAAPDDDVNGRPLPKNKLAVMIMTLEPTMIPSPYGITYGPSKWRSVIRWAVLAGLCRRANDTHTQGGAAEIIQVHNLAGVQSRNNVPVPLGRPDETRSGSTGSRTIGEGAVDEERLRQKVIRRVLSMPRTSEADSGSAFEVAVSRTNRRQCVIELSENVKIFPLVDEDMGVSSWSKAARETDSLCLRTSEEDHTSASFDSARKFEVVEGFANKLTAVAAGVRLRGCSTNEGLAIRQLRRKRDYCSRK